jgi:signal transduction histidine kinase
MLVTLFPTMREKQVQKTIDSREVYELLSIVSHELKTPITSIKAYAGILEKRLGKRKDIKNIYFLNHINEQADRITLLVNRILDINRLESGSFLIQPDLFNFDTLLTKLVIDFQHMTDTHQIETTGDEVGEIVGDAERIREVLINLMTNAIKYSPGESSILIHKNLEEKYLTVSIKDFGTGIPRSKHKQIFQRDFQIHKGGDVGKISSGLGLYIASEIVRLHKGKIWVESWKGKGSLFSFTLPTI